MSDTAEIDARIIELVAGALRSYATNVDGNIPIELDDLRALATLIEKPAAHAPPCRTCSLLAPHHHDGHIVVLERPADQPSGGGTPPPDSTLDRLRAAWTASGSTPAYCKGCQDVYRTGNALVAALEAALAERDAELPQCRRDFFGAQVGRAEQASRADAAEQRVRELEAELAIAKQAGDDCETSRLATVRRNHELEAQALDAEHNLGLMADRLARLASTGRGRLDRRAAFDAIDGWVRRGKEPRSFLVDELEKCIVPDEPKPLDDAELDRLFSLGFNAKENAPPSIGGILRCRAFVRAILAAAGRYVAPLVNREAIAKALGAISSYDAKERTLIVNASAAVDAVLAAIEAKP